MILWGGVAVMWIMFCKFVVVKLPAWEALIDDPLSKNSVRVADVKNTSVSTV